MAKKLFSIILLLCSVFNSFSEETEMDKLHKNEAILRSTLDFIEKHDFTDSSIRKLTGSTNENSIQLGFGLQQYCDEIYGGSDYLLVEINYIMFREQLIRMVVLIYGYDRIKDYVGTDLQERYSRIFSRNDGHSYKYEDELNYEKYNDYKKEIVGECKAVVIPQEYKEYYDCLYSVDECEPLSSNIYGYAYGIAGTKPDGRIAMEKLLKLNDKDIFISLLKGDHPAGRIYAAEGLLRLENSKENVDLINQIFSTLVRNGIRYTTAGGCIITDEEYEYYKYDRNRKFPEIDDKE